MKTLLLYFFVLLSGFGHAETPTLTAETGTKVPAPLPGLNAIVPYDPAKPIPTAAAHYFLDQETFQRLWTAAARARGDSAALPTDKALALSQAVYQIGLEKDYWLVKGRLSVFTAQPWAELELNFPGATLTDVLIDDAAAAPVKGRLAFEKAGAHAVALTLRLPYDSSVGALKFGFPAAGATLAQVRAPLTAGLFAPESAQLPSTAAEENNQRIVTVALGHATELTMLRQKAVAGAGAGAPAAAAQASADLRQAVELHASWDRLKVEGTYRFPANFAGKLELDFPADFVPMAVETPGAANWELRQDKERGRQVLSFQPARSDSRECTVLLIAERQHAEEIDMEKKGSPAIPLPLATAGSARGSRVVTIFEGRSLQVQPQPTAEHRRLPLPENGGAHGPDARPVASFDYPPTAGPLAVLVGTARQKRRVQADYIFQVGRGKLEEIVTATFFAPGESFVTAAVGLPAGMVPQTVTGPELAEWSLSGERLFLRFQPGTREGATVIIHTAKEIAAAEANVVLQKEGEPPAPDQTAPLPLQSLNFEGFPEVSGHGLLMAHAAEEVLFRIGQGILREEDPANSPVQATILPPFQKKQAFVFKKAVFEATVSLRRLDPQFTATWVLVAGVNESWTTLTWRVDLEIGRSALSGVRLLLPPGLNGVRVTGAEVREVRPVLEDKEHTAMEVTFQHDLLDAVQLQVECDQPAAAAGAEAWLPGITVVGAEAGPAFLILDNLTNWEMSVKEEKTEAARSGDLPFVPAKLNNPRFYRALPGWKVAPVITKLITTGGEKVLISQAELATFIRSNGDEWLRARYRILNRSLQFLPVKLPAGSEVISARVGGEAVRTEKAGDGAADILIPLIQTRPGEISYEVEIVLLRRGTGKLDATLQRKMIDPKLPGLTVQHTLWEVHVPPGYKLEHTGGNMETVDEAESRAERLYSLLSEADKLNRMAKDEKNPLAEQQQAASNSLVLQEKISQELNGRQSGENDRSGAWESQPGAVRNYESQPGAYRLYGKLGDIQQKWGELNKDTQLNYSRINGQQPASALPRRELAYPPGASGVVSDPQGRVQAGRQPQQDLTNWSFNGAVFQEREVRLKQQSEQQAKTLENAAVALNDNLVLDQSVLQRGRQNDANDDESGKAREVDGKKLSEMKQEAAGKDGSAGARPATELFGGDVAYFAKTAAKGQKQDEKPQSGEKKEAAQVTDERAKAIDGPEVFSMPGLGDIKTKLRVDAEQPPDLAETAKAAPQEAQAQAQQPQQVQRQNLGNNARALQNRVQQPVGQVVAGIQLPSLEPETLSLETAAPGGNGGMAAGSLRAPSATKPQSQAAQVDQLGVASGPAAGGVAAQPAGGAPMSSPQPADVTNSRPGMDHTRANRDALNQAIAPSGGTVSLGTNGQRLGYVGGFNANAAPVFKPGGRYALPVELSGETALGQFRKLKGDAELEITLSPVRKGPGLVPALLQLGIALAMLWLVQRIHVRRQRRRVVAVASAT